MEMRATYSKTSALTAKPKTQRAIIADILLDADQPLGFGQIVSAAKKADYEKTLKQRGRTVSVEDSVAWHLGKMVADGVVKEEILKASGTGSPR